MRCKAIGRDFDRECEFLQGTYNGAVFNMALPLQKRLRNFHCSEYRLDSAVRGEGGVAGEGRVVGEPKFHSSGKCTMPL